MSAVRKTLDPYRSAAAVWGSLARRYRDSYAERFGRPMPGDELADRVGCARQTIYSIENGDHIPGDGEKVRRWDDALGANGVLAWLWPFAAQLGAIPIAELLTMRDEAYAEKRRGSSNEKDDSVERRHLFQLALASLGAGVLTSGEPVRQLLDSSLAAAESRDTEDWKLISEDHFYAVTTRPPAQVRDELVIDLLAVERLLDSGRGIDVAEMRRVAARLSAIYASVLTRLGDHGAALRWWRTARRAAERAGDTDLAARICGQEAIFGLYGQRAPGTVLRLTDRGLVTAGSKQPSVGLLKLTGARSQTLAVLGRHDEARQAFDTYSDLAARIPAPSDPYGWIPEDSLHRELDLFVRRQRGRGGDRSTGGAGESSGQG